ncbi:MAG TPA: hypothetical protein VJH22_00185 [Candidatus Nanoarchaeia archaeon]|nr:hypothetical protein [Candidatus Nanoarchaeia archaeon]
MNRYASEKIGIPINAHPHGSKSLRQEFWEDLIALFLVPPPDNVLHIVISIFFAIGFTIRWTGFLIARLFGSRRAPPQTKKHLKQR